MWAVPALVTHNFDVISSDKTAESHTLAIAILAQRSAIASDSEAMTSETIRLRGAVL